MTRTSSKSPHASRAQPELERKVLAAARRLLMARHYAPRTEKAYVSWIRRFMRHYPGRDPRDMGPREVNAFLSSLAVERSVSASSEERTATRWRRTRVMLLRAAYMGRMTTYCTSRSSRYRPSSLFPRMAKGTTRSQSSTRRIISPSRFSTQ